MKIPVSARGSGWMSWLAAGLVAVGCTPVSQSYQIHSGELTCEEANRVVYAAVEDMGMTVTSMRKARPGSPGKVHAVGGGEATVSEGEVTIRCEADGVHIEADEPGMTTSHTFERGIFLSVTGRTGLIRESGELKRREQTAASPARAAAGRGVRVVLEPIRGFATVLDFEADLSAVGVLPVRVQVVNESSRAYELDPADVVLRASGSRRRVRPIPPQNVVDRLDRALGDSSPQAASELGDVAAARGIVRSKQLQAATLGPGEQASGFLYFEAGLYDRARVTLVDVRTGELEGFLVEF